MLLTLARRNTARLLQPGFFHVEDRRLLHGRTERLDRPLDKLSTPGVLFCSRTFRDPKGMMKASPTHDAIRPDTRGNGIEASG
jgi:hypothetical protein